MGRAVLAGASRIEFPTAEAVLPAFMREVGDVHRELYAESAELYGENIRGKVERCIAVSDAEYARRRARGPSCASGRAAALDGFDLLVTPVCRFAVPPADCEEIEVRAATDALHVPVQRSGLAGARCPRSAEDGSASMQSSAGRGTTRSSSRPASR